MDFVSSNHATKTDNLTASTSGIVDDLLEHVRLLYSAKVETFPATSRPMVNLIQRLANACRMLQADCNVTLAQRDLLHERFQYYKIKSEALEASHPNNPDNNMGRANVQERNPGPNDIGAATAVTQNLGCKKATADCSSLEYKLKRDSRPDYGL